MKAYYPFLLLLGILWSCNPIDNNKRLSIQGKVSDSSDDPILGIEIKTAYNYYILGSDLTDMNGNFDFASLAPNPPELKIQFNTKSWRDSSVTYQEDYGSIYYHFNIRDLSSSFTLDTVQLHQKAQLNIEVTSSATDTINFVLKHKKSELHYFVNTDNNLSNYKYDSGNVLPGTTTFLYTYNTLKDTEATLAYRINSGEEQEVIIPINQPTTTYVLSY